jgi:hypothetical protein
MPEEKKELVEGEDYTTDPETGFLVFTAEYLKGRGYCCKNGCRNCPYGFGKDAGG